MAIAASTFEQERRPGDFQRHPRTGAPYVSHPTETTKAGKPRRVMYGRPSSLGKQIENATNLQKWSERAVALGVFVAPELLSELTKIDPDQLHLDDEQAREILDGIAVQAKRAAKATLAADRGTHTHATTEDHDEERDWIERAKAGEDLGLPVEVQAALVEAWDRLIDEYDLEILAVEQTVVDDEWRQAGTLDRIARLGRNLMLPANDDGMAFLIAKGTVVVLDIKTGKLRTDNDRRPSYWNSYAVQIASYAQAVPYDTETDERGEWGYDIDQRFALIAHLDVLSALDGEARARLIPVDLEAGRHAGNLCMAARAWEKRRDVFALVDDGIVVPVTQIAEGGDSSLSRWHSDESPPSAPNDEAERAELRQRFERTRSNAIDTGWVAQFDHQVASLGINKGSTNAEVRAALDSIEPPFDPEPSEAPTVAPSSVASPATIDDGAPIDQATIDAVVNAIGADPYKHVVNDWVAEAHHAGCSWDPRTYRHVRQFEIARAALRLAQAIGDEPIYHRLVLDKVVEHDHTTPIGVVLAGLTIEQARQVAEVAEKLGKGVAVTLMFNEDGTPYLEVAS